MDDDEFEDDIDWGSIDLLTVTPGSLRQCLEMAEVYAIGDDEEDEDVRLKMRLEMNCS